MQWSLGRWIFFSIQVLYYMHVQRCIWKQKYLVFFSQNYVRKSLFEVMAVLFVWFFWFVCIMAQSFIFYKVAMCFNVVAVAVAFALHFGLHLLTVSHTEGALCPSYKWAIFSSSLQILTCPFPSASGNPVDRWQELSCFKVRLDRVKGRNSKRRGIIQTSFFRFCPSVNSAVL